MAYSINGVEIENTFAEAFDMWGSRVIITAVNRKWAIEAASKMTGFATSVIRCHCEGAVEAELERTPDQRPGVSVLFFGFSKKSLAQQLIDRIGQCVLTCPTTACFNGLDAEDKVSVGGQLRFFGDGFQGSKGISDPAITLQAAELAVQAMRQVSGVIMPFPGGIVRSGSKVGSRYKFLKASTNDAFCPSLRSVVDTNLPEGVNSVLEIVINGLGVQPIEEAIRRGIRAACIPGIFRISAGNYGGNLGKFKFQLQEIMK
jgi:formylmethanofuran--tetrahydromethanopterin N-formyltransferase